MKRVEMKRYVSALLLLIFMLALMWGASLKEYGLWAKISTKNQDICFMHDSIPWDYGSGYLDMSGSYITSGNGAVEYWLSDGLSSNSYTSGDTYYAPFKNENRNNNIYFEVAHAGRMFDANKNMYREIAVKLYPYTNNTVYGGCIKFGYHNKRLPTFNANRGAEYNGGTVVTTRDYYRANKGHGEPKFQFYASSTDEWLSAYPTNIYIDVEFYWAEPYSGRASNVKVPNPRGVLFLNDIDGRGDEGDSATPEGFSINVPNGSYSFLYQCGSYANLHDQYKGAGYSSEVTAGGKKPVHKVSKDIVKLSNTNANVSWGTSWSSKTIGPTNNKKSYTEFIYGRSYHGNDGIAVSHGQQMDWGTGGIAFECYNSTGFTILYKAGQGWGMNLSGNNRKVDYRIQGTIPEGYTKDQLEPGNVYVTDGTFLDSSFSTKNAVSIPGYTFSGWRTGSADGALYQGTTATGGIEGLRSNIVLYGKYTKIKATAKGTKEWIGGKAGDRCTVQLMRSKNKNLSNSEEVTGYTQTLSWSRDKVEFSQGSLDAYDDSDHLPWYYWWKETSVSDGYRIETTLPSYATAADTLAPVTIIKNSYVTVSPEVEKVWVDSVDTSNRPTTLSLDLMQKVGSATEWEFVQSVTVKSADSWVYTKSGMPAYRNGVATTYCFRESSVPTGYDKTSETVVGNKTTITNTLKLKTINVSKTWDDENDFDGLRPSDLDVYVKRGTTTLKTLTLSSSNNWFGSHTVSMYHNGSVATYSVLEESIEYYSEVKKDGFGVLVEMSDGTGWNIRLKNYHEVIKTDYNVKKKWDDTNDLDRVRTDSVKVQLYRDGVKYGSEVTLNASNSWNHTWAGLCRWNNRKLVAYSVKEVAVPTYYTHVIKNLKVETIGAPKVEKHYDEVINTHVPVCELTVTKKVPRSDVYDPFGVQSYIYKVTGVLLDGSTVEYYQMLTPRLNNSTGYYEASYTWRDLWSGRYTVKELPVDRFTNSSVTGSGNNNGTKDTMVFNLSCRGPEEGSVLYTGKIKNYKDYTHTDSSSGMLK